jgi:hypothetical protein
MTTTISALRKLATQKAADGHLSAADVKQLVKAAGVGASAVAKLQKISDEFAAVITSAGMVEMNKVLGLGPHPGKTTDITPAMHTALMNTFSNVRDSMGEPFPSMPLGNRFVREPLFSEKHIDGYHFAAMVPAGVLGFCNPPSDPNKATTCYIERSGGKTGNVQYFGPFDIVRGAAPKMVVVDADDNGKTLKVKKGQDVVVSLSKAGGSGYNWFVTGTDRSFAYPVTDENKVKFQGPSMCGGPVYQVMTWKTNSPFVQAGETHKVELELKRGQAGKAAEKFSFSVKIV